MTKIKSDDNTLSNFIGVILAIVFVVVATTAVVDLFYVTHKENCLINYKYEEKYGSSKIYMVNTTCGNYEVLDSIVDRNIAGDGTKRWTALKAGTRYDFKIRGFKVKVLGMYPNIVEETERP